MEYEIYKPDYSTTLINSFFMDRIGLIVITVENIPKIIRFLHRTKYSMDFIDCIILLYIELTKKWPKTN